MTSSASRGKEDLSDRHPATGRAPRRNDAIGGPDQITRQPAFGDSDLAGLAGMAAVVFPLVYFASGLVEVAAQGDFTTARLALAYIGEAGIALTVIGLYAVQRPRIGRLGLYGALAYAYSFAFFASTVVYALAAGSTNWKALVLRGEVGDYGQRGGQHRGQGAIGNQARPAGRCPLGAAGHRGNGYEPRSTLPVGHRPPGVTAPTPTVVAGGGWQQTIGSRPGQCMTAPGSPGGPSPRLAGAPQTPAW